MIANREDSVRRFIRKLGSPEHLRACYEAGPTGFVLYWQLTQLGVKCDVVAPSLVPKKPGDRVKTDRRDALKLARSHRSDDLTAVWVPDEGSEALRDLVRAREAAKQDQLRAKHRLTKFLLRTGRRPALGVKGWTEKYVEWVQQVRYTHPAQEATLLDCLNEVQHMEERVKRLEQSIVEVIQLAPAPMQEVVRGLQALRGIAHISQSRLLSSWATSPPASRARVTLWGIAEYFRAKTPAARVFEQEALPSQATRTSDESWSNRPGAIATGQRSEPGCAGDRKGFRQRSPRLHGKRRIACTSAT